MGNEDGGPSELWTVVQMEVLLVCSLEHGFMVLKSLTNKNNNLKKKGKLVFKLPLKSVLVSGVQTDSA